MFDTVVVGLGATGSAALHYLARRGVRVLGIDRHAPPHTLGSTHGGSRIIRKAYAEGERYLPLLARAYELWAELEAESGRSLMDLCGCLNVGPPDSAWILAALRSAELVGLDHEVLSGAETARRFPVYQVPEGSVALLDHEAGLIRPERCVRTHLELARKHGAAIRLGEAVTTWQSDGSRIRIATGDTEILAGGLILCAGAWMRDLMPGGDLPVRIERVTNVWFVPLVRPELYVPARFPAFIWAAPDVHVYGLPDLGRGVKAGLHHAGVTVSHPSEVSRAVTDADVDDLRRRLVHLLPGVAGSAGHRSVCMYTNTPDLHWVIDTLADDPPVVFASACSGHGFKASAAVGEVLADLALGRAPTVDIDAFRRRW